MSKCQNLYLYEINAMVLVRRLSKVAKKKITLGKIPLSYWKDLKEMGYDVIWLMGVWQRSPQSTKVARSIPSLQKEYTAIHGNWKDKDVSGSPYAIQDYNVDPEIGSDKELKKLHSTLQKIGLRLVLDFVPNHVALDHAWTKENPNHFFQLNPDQIPPDSAHNFIQQKNTTWLAHGKDPYFDAWTDTLQINYFNPETRKAMIQILLQIASFCDGVRCDMAMLIISRIFQQTWGNFQGLYAAPDHEFWQEAISTVKKSHPDFIFIAEAYWNMEWELQQQGFDFTYDKTLYDRLAHSHAIDIRNHLLADLDYQNHSVRFLENHDEPRTLSTLPFPQAKAAAVIAFCIPGMKLVFDGQKYGKKIRLPVQLGTEPKESIHHDTYDFYKHLLEFIRTEVKGYQDRKLLDNIPACENNDTHSNMISWVCGFDKKQTVLVVNYSGITSQCRLKLPKLPKKGDDQIAITDLYTGEIYRRSIAEINTVGLYINLKPWNFHWLSYDCE